MLFRWRASFFGWTGAGALILFFLYCSIPNFLALKVTPDEAQTHIRAYLEREASRQFTQSFEDRATGLPTAAEGQAYKEEMQRIRATEFVAVAVKHFLVAPPFTIRRIFIVRTDLRDPDGAVTRRYFSISTQGKGMTYPWVNDAPPWMWLLSI